MVVCITKAIPIQQEAILQVGIRQVIILIILTILESLYTITINTLSQLPEAFSNHFFTGKFDLADKDDVSLFKIVSKK